jgi:anaerobic magnesium-protoporphyrin IX monomethyl ester cyclase
LDKMQKGTTCKQAEEAVRAAKSAGIITVCYFLLGGYGESREDSNKTIDFAKKLDCDIAKFNITVPYPGSKLFDLFKQKHNISFASFDNISSWADWTFGYKRFPNEEGSSGEELAKLQRKAMFSFYFRPETVTRMRIFFRYGFSVKYILAGVYVMCGIFIKNVFSFLLNKTQPRF